MRQHPFDVGIHEMPGTHVLGLLLAPHDFSKLETAKLADQRARRERIELFDAKQVDVIDALLLTRFIKIVIDLARTQNDTLDLIVGEQFDRFRRSRLCIVLQDTLERSVRSELLESRHHPLMPKQRFRRHQNEWLAEFTQQLPAQNVKIIGGRGTVRHLPVVFRAQLQPALKAS